MKIESNETPEIIVPLGQALKDARLVASLSIDEVAEQLHLSLSTVRDIEDNLNQIHEDKKYPDIYLRGYLANYAKLVGIGTLESYVEYQQLSAIQSKKKIQLVPDLIIPQAKKRSKLMPLTLLTVVVFGTVLYLGQTPEVSQLEKLTSPSETIAEKVKPVPVVNLDVQKRVQPIKKSDKTTEALNTKKPVKPQKSAQTENVGKVAEPVVAIVEAKKKAPLSERVTTPEKTVEATPVNLEMMTLTFSDECWTEISDASGQRIAYGLYKKGRVLTLSGIAPFKLKLGDPSVVEIEYNDQVIEGKFRPGRTARFSVPLS